MTIEWGRGAEGKTTTHVNIKTRLHSFNFCMLKTTMAIFLHTDYENNFEVNFINNSLQVDRIEADPFHWLTIGKVSIPTSS